MATATTPPTAETVLCVEELGFLWALDEALHTPGMVENFNRLYGTRLGLRGPKTPIDAMVDKATGHDVQRQSADLADMKKFAAFVRRCVWDTLPPEARQDISRVKILVDETNPTE